MKVLLNFIKMSDLQFMNDCQLPEAIHFLSAVTERCISIWCSTKIKVMKFLQISSYNLYSKQSYSDHHKKMYGYIQKLHEWKMIESTSCYMSTGSKFSKK